MSMIQMENRQFKIGDIVHWTGAIYTGQKERIIEIDSSGNIRGMYLNDDGSDNMPSSSYVHPHAYTLIKPFDTEWD